MRNKKRICVVTGNRAEYGLLRPVMRLLQENNTFDLQTVVTGKHFEREYGETFREIQLDGFRIDARLLVESEDDSPKGVLNSISLGVREFSDVVCRLKPDLVLVLGDRYEIFAIAIAAYVNRIPIAHLHGGETTFGAFDEAFRHSITKMSSFHFVAAEEYRRRVIQLGEDPSNVFLVGGLGVDALRSTKLLDKKEIESRLGIELKSKSLLITYHPATLESETAECQIKELLAALEGNADTTLIFTYPNGDNGSASIIRTIKEFTESHPNAFLFKTLGQELYFSCLATVDGVIGNSSSGLAEAPSFKKATVNIGSRQKGRLQALSVINCEPDKESIRLAIAKMYSEPFKETLKSVINPYGEGGASREIVGKLGELNLNLNIQKSFYDLPSCDESWFQNAQ